MKTKIIYLLISMLSPIILSSQMYVHFNGGIADHSEIKEKNTLVYSVGLRYQPERLGVQFSYGQTVGVQHSFDSYTVNGIYTLKQGYNFQIYSRLGYTYNTNFLYGDTHGYITGISNHFRVADEFYATLDWQTGFYDISKNMYTLNYISIGVSLSVNKIERRTRKFDRFF